MGFWATIKSWFSKPEPTLDAKVAAAIAEKESQIKELEKQIADLIALRKKQEKSLGEADHLMDKWTNVCKAATETKKEGNVRAAVTEMLVAKSRQEQIKKEIARINEVIDPLRDQIRIARENIEDAKTNHATLEARLQSAKIREGLADQDGPLGSMSKLEDEAVEAESRAQAKEEINRDILKDSSKVDPLEVEAEIKKLMKK